jgi:hypothetical protein
MMQCKYRYQAGDKLVISGKKNIGDGCMARSATEENGGYCPGHARRVGAMPQEKVEATNRKHKETWNDIRTKNGDKKKELTKDIIEGCKTEHGGKLKINHEVLEAMGLTSQCDIRYELGVFVATNAKPGVKYWNEKMAFAKWLETPAHLRVPPTMEEAADILGVSIKALMLWKSSPEIINFINDDIESRSSGLYKMFIYKLGEGIQRGDKGCMELFAKHFKERKDSKKSGHKELDIPAEMQKEADEFGETINKENRGAALKTEKMLLNNGYFNTTLTPKTETEQ